MKIMMKIFYFLTTMLIWFLLTISEALAENIIFPADAGVVNVKTFGAKGDGKTDDTAAIQNVIKSLKAHQTLYFPNGTYLVSSTLVYPAGKFVKRWKCVGCIRGIFTQGQSRDGTVIKLKDNAAGFHNPNSPKPVIETMAGNQAFGYRFFNLTIDIGAGNPGASGIAYVSNNNGAIGHVRIVSSDPEKKGARGIDMSRKWPGPALVKNVSIEGFDYGIYIQRWVYGMAFEHLTLLNQRKVGIFNKNNVIAIRGLKSFNAVPVIHNHKGSLTVVDGEFYGGSSSFSAIEHVGVAKGSLFARNIVTSGYHSAIMQEGRAIPGDTISEYASEPIARLFSDADTSLNLPVEETPDVPWDAENNFEHWVNVGDFGAIPDDARDDAAAVQRAIDEANRKGKTTVYFPFGRYIFTETVRVWGSVRRIIGMGALLRIKNPLMSAKGPVFRLEQGQDVVVFERFIVRPHERGRQFDLIEHAAANTVVFKYGHGRGGFYRNVVTGGRAFFEDWTSYLRITGPQQIWARQWNPETPTGPLTRAVNNGGRLWVLLMKTEGDGVYIENKGGGRVEVLGALLARFRGKSNQHVGFVNYESHLSLSGFSLGYEQAVVETRNGKTATLYNRDSRRFSLYVGHAVERPIATTAQNE